MAGHRNIGSAQSQSFSKAERLNSKKLMDELFNKGSSFVLYPFRVYWMKHEQPVPSKVQVLISVPKKNFPLAVDRNRIKRLMREAYRKNKFLIIDSMNGNEKNLAVAFLFTGKNLSPQNLTPNPSLKQRGMATQKKSSVKNLPQYKLVEEKMIEALNQLSKNSLK
ncbi:hypothetical protein LBMAG27_18990 [Bacteroidota bacterium]|nr:hypothetical protein LBMAG27_18990 [Bacteroidota bacterium]